jgi:hypothetical protein|tara:strand:+ start:731 stop:1174 length:444 start_codon:yes stop_codon:yes gene_type:complete
MITLNELQDTWKTDCKIDELNLGSESIKTAELHSKYLNHLTNFKLQLRKFESQMLTLRRVKWRYFRGELSKLELDDLGWEQYLGPQPLKNEMQEYLDSDSEIIKINDKLDYVRACLYQCESIMKSLNSRTWDIKNAVEWTKFTNGSF